MITKNSGTTNKLLIALGMLPPLGGGGSREHEPKDPDQSEDRVKEVHALLKKAGIELDGRNSKNNCR